MFRWIIPFLIRRLFRLLRRQQRHIIIYVDDMVTTSLNAQDFPFVEGENEEMVKANVRHMVRRISGQLIDHVLISEPDLEKKLKRLL